MTPIRLCLLLLVGLALPSPTLLAVERVPLTTALRRADVVVLATVDDPATDQTLLRVRGGADFVRLQWRLRVQEVLVGGGVRPGELVRVDESRWRGDLAARRRCKGREPCAMPAKDGYASQLSRPPVPGQQVLALLRRTRGGLELALERAMDAPQVAAQVPRRPRRGR